MSQDPAVCYGFDFNNTTPSLNEALTLSLSAVVGLDSSGLDLSDHGLLSSLYCAADSTVCHGVCSNADLGGVGVRVAFWLSSILQAILVIISPEDSSPSAWTSTILTASIIIPGIVQKRQGILSLYHSTLVLNFATYSTIVSLAVAPMCSVWRSDDEEELREQKKILYSAFREEGHFPLDHDQLSNLPRSKVHRQRLILSLALITQVCLQWSWIIFLFADPEYNQSICNAHTNLILFAHIVRTSDHNSFAIWLCWLIFHGIASFIWTILLVFNSSPSVHPVLSRQGTSRSDDLPSPGGKLSGRRWLSLDRGRFSVLAWNSSAFLIAVLLLGTSEAQAQLNCIRGGENTQWGFGQITALLLALSPAWAIAIALSKSKKNTGSSTDSDDGPVPPITVEHVLDTPHSSGSGSPLPAVNGDNELGLRIGPISEPSTSLIPSLADLSDANQSSFSAEEIMETLDSIGEFKD